MPTAEKIAAVEEIKERLQNSRCVILTKYIGINAAQANDLRTKLRTNAITYKVYKNNLAKIALDELGFSDAAAFMDGPTAWAFAEDDPVAPSKVFKTFNKDVPHVEMNGGIIAGQVVSKDQLNAIADLPSREELIAQTVGVLVAPLRSLLGVMSATPRDFVSVLDQVRQQKEESGEAA